MSDTKPKAESPEHMKADTESNTDVETWEVRIQKGYAWIVSPSRAITSAKEATPEFISVLNEVCEEHNAALVPRQAAGVGDITTEAALEICKRISDYDEDDVSEVELIIHAALQSAQPLQKASGGQEGARLFGELMALMNGDGGHYQSEHGSQKAFERAVMRWEERYRRMDAAELRFTRITYAGRYRRSS